MKRFASVLLALSFVITSYAQSECNYFHRKNCAVEEGVTMRYDSQSKSAIMAKGQTSEFHLVAYKGLDYRITLCADELIGTQVQLKIFEKNRVLIKPKDPYAQEEISNEEEQESDEEDSYDDASYDDYSEDYSDAYADSYEEETNSSAKEGPKFRIEKELLYDNADNAYSNSIEFTADGTMSLILEITIPGEGGAGKLKIREMGCVGVLIEHEKAKKTGF